jgi:hypothetical protein
MSAPPGRVVRGIRRAFAVNPGRALSTRDLWQWTHPREVRCRDRFRRKNISRAIRRAAMSVGLVRVGRVWPGHGDGAAGILWRLGTPMGPSHISDGASH